jgi:DNA replication protein DnaC
VIAHEYVDLTFRILPDEEYSLLVEKYPLIKSPCPTCRGVGTYSWDGDPARKCDCDLQRALYLNYLSAGIGELYQRLDWPDYSADTQALDAATAWLDGHARLCEAGMGLAFLGPVGTGKTMLVSLVAKELVKLGRRVFFTTFAEMIDMFTSTWGGNEAAAERFERKVVESQILILDDIGKEFRSKTNLQESTFDHVLRQRAVALRPTILTTNMTE